MLDHSTYRDERGRHGCGEVFDGYGTLHRSTEDVFRATAGSCSRSGRRQTNCDRLIQDAAPHVRRMAHSQVLPTPVELMKLPLRGPPAWHRFGSVELFL